MADPVQDIPRYATNEVVDLHWAENVGAAVEPIAGRKDTGYLTNDVVTRQEINWLSRDPMRFIRAVVARFPNASEAMFASFMPPGDFGIWQNAVNPLDVYLTDSGGVDSIVADVWVDPDDEGATRVQVNVPLGDPQTLVATRDTFVYVPNTMTAPPVVSRPEVTFLDVPINDPAPAAPAGTVPVWRIRTDGVGITQQEIILQRFPVMKTIGFEAIAGAGDINLAGNADIQGNLMLGGNAEIDGDLTVEGNTVLGDNIADTVVSSGPVTVGTNLTVNGNTVLGDAAGDTTQVNGPFSCTVTATFNGNVNLGNAAGDTILVLGTLSIAQDLTLTTALIANGACTLGNAAADTITINGTTTINEDVDFGANTITGAGGTITTSTVNASTVAPTTVNFNTTASATASGRVTYDGSRLTVGNGTVARNILSPNVAYVVSDDTSAATDDLPGATVSLTIGDNQWVYAKVEAIQQSDSANEDVKILLAATNGVDNVAILNSGDADQAQLVLPTVVAANDRSPTGFTVRWKPTNDIGAPDNTSWTIYVRHGITGAKVLTTSNVLLHVWYE